MSLRIALTHHNPDVLIMDIGDQVTELAHDAKYDASMELESYLGVHGTLEDLVCMVLAYMYGDDYAYAGVKLTEDDLRLQRPQITDDMSVGEAKVIKRNWMQVLPRNCFCARIWEMLLRDIECHIVEDKKPVHVAVHHHTLVLVFADLDFKNKVDAALEEIKADFMGLANKKPKRPWNAEVSQKSGFSSWANKPEVKEIFDRAAKSLEGTAVDMVELARLAEVGRQHEAMVEDMLPKKD